MEKKQNPQQLRVLYVINKLHTGGAERQIVELIKGLDKSQYEPFIAIFVGNGIFLNDIKKMKIPTFIFKRKKKWDLIPIIGLVKLIRHLKIEIVHCYLTLGCFYGGIASLVTGVPMVNSSIRKSSSQTKYKEYMQKLTFWFSDAIVANSIAGRDFFLKKENHKAHVVHNGIDLNRFDVKIDGVKKKKEWGLCKCKRIVTMVADMEDRKDYYTYLKAAKRVTRCHKDVCFLCVGEGSMKNEILAFMHKERINNNVFLLGERSDVEEILAITDIFVLCSAASHGEGISNSILEAMAMGCPVIATSSGGTKEIIENGKTGILIPPRDSDYLIKNIIDLLNNNEKKAVISDNGRTWVKKNFNLEKMVVETQALYRRIIN